MVQLTGTEYFLALIPPGVAVATGLLFSFPLSKTIKRQVARIGRESNLDDNKIIMMQQVAVSSSILSTLFPGFIGTVAVTGSLISEYGIILLVLTLVSMTLFIVAVFIMMQHDLRELHGRMSNPFSEEPRRPYRVTWIRFIELLIIGMNLFVIIGVTIRYLYPG